MVNLTNYTKKELTYMMTHTCKKHGHKYIEHTNCYLKEQRKEKKIGYFDVESGGLNANFDILLTWCIKTRDKNEYVTGCITKKDIWSYEMDKRILKELISALNKYDVIVGYYTTGFDLPFCRTRSLMNGLDFLPFGSVLHKDVYYMVRHRLKLHRNSLDAACAALGIRGKNHIKGNFWMRAKLGDPVALEYVLDHNKKDCAILEQLHKKLENYVKDSSKSI